MKKAIIMLSGGPDSLALLHMISSSYDKLYCVYVHEKLDPESLKGLEFAERSANKFGATFFVYTSILNPTLSNHHRAIKDAIEHYSLLCDCRDVYMGHNKDDVYENMLLGLFKNMPHNCIMEEVLNLGNISIHRPLVSKTKKQIIEYCNENGLIEGVDYYIAKINSSEDDIRGILRNYLFKKVFNLKDCDQYLNSLLKSVSGLLKCREELLVTSKLCAKFFKNMAHDNDQFFFCISKEDMPYFNRHVFLYMVKQVNPEFRFTEKDANKFADFFLVRKNYGVKLTVNPYFYVTVEEISDNFVIYGANFSGVSREHFASQIERLQNGMAI